VKNPFKLLGVPVDASEDAIRGAFRQLVKTLHPDVCTEPGAVERFKAIIQARDTLLDPAKRAALKAKEMSAEALNTALRSRRAKTRRRTQPKPAPPPPPPAQAEPPPGLFLNVAELCGRDLPPATWITWILLGALADRELGTSHVKRPPRG
jgi:curved DNA-binding protein CbpA